MDARLVRQLQVLFRRFLCKGGNGVNVPVTAAAATIAVPLELPEPDGLYGVNVTPDWLTTVRVTAKLTTQFTVDFGTAAPGGGGLIDYIIFRME